MFASITLLHNVTPAFLGISQQKFSALGSDFFLVTNTTHRFETPKWPPCLLVHSIHVGGENCLCQEGSTMIAVLKHGPLDPSPVQMLLDHSCPYSLSYLT